MSSTLRMYLECCGLRAWIKKDSHRSCPPSLARPRGREVELALQKEANATINQFLQYEYELDDDEMSADDHASDMEMLGLAVKENHTQIHACDRRARARRKAGARQERHRRRLRPKDHRICKHHGCRHRQV